MSRSPWVLVALLMIAGLLSGVVLVAPPVAAVSTTTWTSTADFDAGTKDTGSELTTWVNQTSMALPVPIADVGGASYGGYAWSIGGYENGSTDPKTYNLRYDPTVGQWSIKAPMPTARWGAMTTVWADRIYAFSGSVGPTPGGERQIAQYYNITLDQWTSLAATPATLNQTGICAWTSGLYVYLLNGTNFVRYEPASDTYNDAAVANPGVNSGAWSSCARIGAYLYVFGGTTSGNPARVMRYDVGGNTWDTAYDSVRAASNRYGMSRYQPVISGLVYLVNGLEGSTFYSEGIVYDPSVKQWGTVDIAPVARDGVGDAVIAGTLYVFGGRNTNPPLIGLTVNAHLTYGSDGASLVVTTTDNPAVASGAVSLESLHGDGFSVSDPNADTWKWNKTILAGHGDSYSAVAGILELLWTSQTGTEEAQLNLRSRLSGNFDIRVKVTEVVHNDIAIFAVYELPNWKYNSAGQDGYMIVWYNPDTFQIWRIVGGAITSIKTSAGRTATTYYLRITRATDTFSFYSSTDSQSWTPEVSETLAQPTLLYPVISVEHINNLAEDWQIDDFRVYSGALNPDLYRTSGSWTSPAVSAGKLERITLGHSGLSATYAIDAVEVLDGGAVVETFDTDITSGTSTTLTPTLAFRSSPQVRVTLKGDGAGTPILESVEIDVTAGEGVLPGRPVPGFAYDAGLWGCTVSFTDTTYGEVNVTEWAWDFGDGATSRERNPVHTFQGCPMLRGSFVVTLEIRTETDQLWVSTRRVEWDRIPLLFVIAIAAAVLAVWGLAVLRREEVRALRRVLRRR